MKVILEFDPFEDAEELKLAQEGARWAVVVSDLDQWLRNAIKHGDNDEKEEKFLETIRSKLWSLCEKRDLSL